MVVVSLPAEYQTCTAVGMGVVIPDRLLVTTLVQALTISTANMAKQAPGRDRQTRHCVLALRVAVCFVQCFCGITRRRQPSKFRMAAWTMSTSMPGGWCGCFEQSLLVPPQRYRYASGSMVRKPWIALYSVGNRCSLVAHPWCCGTARHDYCGVKEDLETYWPKLRRGGILAGHDYL